MLDRKLGVLLVWAFYLLFHACSGVKLTVNNCNGERVRGEVKNIVFEPCKQFPCHFERGETANLTVEFEPSIDSDGVYFKYFLRTGRPVFDMILQVQDADPTLCKRPPGFSRLPQTDKLDCPLKAGQQYSAVIKRTFPLSTKYNYFNFVKIQLFNNQNQMIGCADSPIQLQSLDIDA